MVPYHPPPPPEYPDEPRLYKYAYSVDDDYEGAVLNVKEESDEYGTQGSYEVKHHLYFILKLMPPPPGVP